MCVRSCPDCSSCGLTIDCKTRWCWIWTHYWIMLNVCIWLKPLLNSVFDVVFMWFNNFAKQKAKTASIVKLDDVEFEYVENVFWFVHMFSKSILKLHLMFAFDWNHYWNHVFDWCWLIEIIIESRFVLWGCDWLNHYWIMLVIGFELSLLV